MKSGKVGMLTLKRMAECAWNTTSIYIEECESPAEVALTFTVALRAIAEYQALLDEEESDDNHQEFKELRIVDLDDCPGYQFLIGNETE